MQVTYVRARSCAFRCVRIDEKAIRNLRPQTHACAFAHPKVGCQTSRRMAAKASSLPPPKSGHHPRRGLERHDRDTHIIARRDGAERELPTRNQPRSISSGVTVRPPQAPRRCAASRPPLVMCLVIVLRSSAVPGTKHILSAMHATQHGHVEGSRGPQSRVQAHDSRGERDGLT